MSEQPQNSTAAKNVSVGRMLSTGVQKQGKVLLSHFGIATKVARLYDGEHQNVREALDDLEKTVNEIIGAEGFLQLTRFEDFLLVNEVRVKLDFGGAENYRYIVSLFKDRGLGEILMQPGTTRDELQKLLTLLNRPVPESDTRFEDFQKVAQTKGFQQVTFGTERERREQGDEVFDDARAVSFRTFFKCCYGVKNALNAARTGSKANLKRLKRAVQAMVDMTLTGENYLLPLVNIKEFATPEANHAVNVAVLSIALGERLGLAKKLLGDLGMAALLHDMGKVRMPEGLPPREFFNQSQEDLYKKHVYYGPEKLLLQRIANATVKSVNVAFLHHYRFDGTGYPKLVRSKEQNLFTRIVAVADFYDNWTTPRSMVAEAAKPEEVLRKLMAGSGTEFDPLVVKAFINLLGLYPVGCMVLLDNGEVGTVVEPSPDAQFLDRPAIRLVLTAEGHANEGAVNLLDRDASGGFKRSILKIYQQEEVDLNIEEYLSVL